MRTVRCPECGRELEIPQNARQGDIIDCPFWAGLSLRLREEEDRFVAIPLKNVSCPDCGRIIVLRDDAKPGDVIRCCNRDYRLTYEFGSYALEGLKRVVPWQKTLTLWHLLLVERISLRITFPSARKFPEEFKGFFSAPGWAFHHNPSFGYVNSLTSSLVPALWRCRPP